MYGYVCLRVCISASYPVVFPSPKGSVDVLGTVGLLQRLPGCWLLLFITEGGHQSGQGSQDGRGLLTETHTFLDNIGKEWGNGAN